MKNNYEKLYLQNKNDLILNFLRVIIINNTYKLFFVAKLEKLNFFKNKIFMK